MMKIIFEIKLSFLKFNFKIFKYSLLSLNTTNKMHNTELDSFDKAQEFLQVLNHIFPYHLHHNKKATIKKIKELKQFSLNTSHDHIHQSLNENQHIQKFKKNPIKTTKNNHTIKFSSRKAQTTTHATH